ncbi:MAG: hypothetical protein ACK5UG_00055 [Synechococcaceae cyanobacterium]
MARLCPVKEAIVPPVTMVIRTAQHSFTAASNGANAEDQSPTYTDQIRIAALKCGANHVKAVIQA